MDGFIAWDRSIRDIAPLGYTFCVNVSMFMPEFTHLTFSRKWTDYYMKHNFPLRDPIMHWANYNDGYTRWSNVPNLDKGIVTKRVMEMARAHGYNFGIVCVTKNPDPMRRTCFLTAAHGEREFTDIECEELWSLFKQGLKNLISPSGLTSSEIEVLQLLARGKTQEEIADQLGLARSSVKKRIERARETLDANNTIHAVAIGIAKGTISAV